MKYRVKIKRYTIMKWNMEFANVGIFLLNVDDTEESLFNKSVLINHYRNVCDSQLSSWR